MMRKITVALVALLFLAPATLYANEGHSHTTVPTCATSIKMKSDGKTDLVIVTTRCSKVYYFRMENGRYIPVDKEKNLEA